MPGQIPYGPQPGPLSGKPVRNLIFPGRFVPVFTMVFSAPGKNLRTLPVWDLSRVALARTGPAMPVVPRTNPVQDQNRNVIWDVD